MAGNREREYTVQIGLDYETMCNASQHIQLRVFKASLQTNRKPVSKKQQQKEPSLAKSIYVLHEFETQTETIQVESKIEGGEEPGRPD